jgi:hypothetical protein
MFLLTPGASINIQSFVAQMCFISNLKRLNSQAVKDVCVACCTKMNITNNKKKLNERGHWLGLLCFKTGMDTKPHVSRHVTLANWAMCLSMLPPDLVWVDAGWVPKGFNPASQYSPSATCFHTWYRTVLLRRATFPPHLPSSMDWNRTSRPTSSTCEVTSKDDP